MASMGRCATRRGRRGARAGRGLGAPRQACGHRVPRPEAAIRADPGAPTLDGPAPGPRAPRRRATSPRGLGQRRRGPPQGLGPHRGANDARPQAPVGPTDVETPCGLRSGLSVSPTARGGPLGLDAAGPSLGDTEAPASADQSRGPHARLTRGRGLPASARAVGQGPGLCASLGLPAHADAWEALAALSLPAPSHRLRPAGGGLSHRVHAAPHTVRHGMDHRRRTRPPGPAGARAEGRLGARPATGRSCSTHA